MIYVDMCCMDEKKDGHNRGKDYAVGNGNPNKFKATPRAEYEKGEKVDYKQGLTERAPL